jgi:hypothetical protein
MTEFIETTNASTFDLTDIKLDTGLTPDERAEHRALNAKFERAQVGTGPFAAFDNPTLCTHFKALVRRGDAAVVKSETLVRQGKDLKKQIEADKLESGAVLVMLKFRVNQTNENWYDYVKKNCECDKRRADELIELSEGRTTFSTLRQQATARQAKRRDAVKKAMGVTSPVTPIQTPPPIITPVPSPPADPVSQAPMGLELVQSRFFEVEVNLEVLAIDSEDNMTGDAAEGLEDSYKAARDAVETYKSKYLAAMATSPRPTKPPEGPPQGHETPDASIDDAETADAGNDATPAPEVQRPITDLSERAGILLENPGMMFIAPGFLVPNPDAPKPRGRPRKVKTADAPPAASPETPTEASPASEANPVPAESTEAAVPPPDPMGRPEGGWPSERASEAPHETTPSSFAAYPPVPPGGSKAGA